VRVSLAKNMPASFVGFFWPQCNQQFMHICSKLITEVINAQVSMCNAMFSSRVVDPSFHGTEQVISRD
jgi:hypothetical protein